MTTRTSDPTLPLDTANTADSGSETFDARETISTSAEALLAPEDHFQQSSQTGPLPHEAPHVCEMCGGDEDVQFCSACDTQYCHLCWDKQFVHTKNKPGPRGLPHEKTGPDIASRLRNVLNSPEDDSVRAELFRDDEQTAWFGSC